MLIDTHAHLNFLAFDDDRNEIIARCQKKGMVVINVGTQLTTSVGAIELAKNFSADGGNFFASIAIHPIHIGKYIHDSQESNEHELFATMGLPKMFEKISALAENKEVVAIGETGLDYFRIDDNVVENKLLQKEYFLKHIDLAIKNNLPIILHCRGSQGNPNDAYEDVLEIIKDKKLRGVIHCFGANLEIAQKFIDLGFYVGFTGIVTFTKKAEELQAVAKAVPLDKILIETDCPYLAPEPYRGQRNEPIYVEYVAQKIAALKRLTSEEVVEATAENAKRLFKI